jgi:hypothetical protein
MLAVRIDYATGVPDLHRQPAVAAPGARSGILADHRRGTSVVRAFYANLGLPLETGLRVLSRCGSGGAAVPDTPVAVSTPIYDDR